MQNQVRKHHSICLPVVTLCLLLTRASLALPDSSVSPKEEQAIKDVLAEFYAGWNAHDVKRMVSVYAEDVDHINTRAEWNKGKTAIQQALARAHSGPLKNNQKTYAVEKIRLIKPDVAAVQVRSQTTADNIGNLGTYVMSRENGKWLVVSFTNIEYKLSPGADAK